MYSICIKIIRISERTAAEIEGYRLFEGKADCREICNAWPRLNIAERNTERLSITEKEKNTAITVFIQ